MRIILGKTKTEKSIRNVYILSFVLLLLSYVATLFSNRKLVQQAERVQHTNLVIKNLDNILAYITDAETATRGYVVTGDIRFLLPYYGAEKRIDSVYTILSDLVEDRDVQVVRLTELKGYLSERINHLKFSLNSFDQNNRVRTDTMKKLQPQALRLMESIRSKISVMEREEERLLQTRSDKMKWTFTAIDTFTFISLLLAFALIIFGFFTYMQVSKSRKKAQEEIEEYQLRLNARINELDEANTELIKMRSQEKFAATGRIARTIAHEVRNPLTNINLAADQLKDELGEGDEGKTFLFDMIGRNSSRINQLISDLLNSTKFSELNYEKILLGEFIDETLKEAEDRITLNGITLIKKYNSTCHISVDKAKMKIALLNIIINAIEAMDKQEKRELTLETKTANKGCIVVISDNGPGMDSESLSRLFEPYFSSKPKGNGLGLTNTQNIVLNHNGEISVTSTEGKGTTFSISLNTVS